MLYRVNDDQQTTGEVNTIEKIIMQCMTQYLIPELEHIEKHPRGDEDNVQDMRQAVDTTKNQAIESTAIYVTDKVTVDNIIELTVYQTALCWAIFKQQTSLSTHLGEKIVAKFHSPEVLIESIQYASQTVAVSSLTGDIITNHSEAEKGYYTTNLATLITQHNLQNFEIKLSPGLNITGNHSLFEQAGIRFV